MSIVEIEIIKWVDPNDCDPPHGLDMQSRHDSDKVHMLYERFKRDGFDITKSALIGYPLDGRIQLLSGTHRHRAAQWAGIKLPVVLWLRSDIEESWGIYKWQKVMEDISVQELESWTREDL